MRVNHRTLVRLFLLLALAWAVAAPGGAEQGGLPTHNRIAELVVGATRIDWLPVADSGRLTLTVAGPEGLWLRKDFEAGQPAFLSLSEPKWEHLPDGSYTWELRATPPPGNLPLKPLVESGHFFVKDGSFVAARKKTPATPSRPPRLLTAQDFVEDGNMVVIGNACIGQTCTNNDDDYSALKLKAPQPNILFDDDFVEGGSTPHDWALFINPSSAAEFSVADVENGLIPFTIAGGAPNSSLYVSGNGNLGVGTATPAVRLDVKANAAGQATERLQNSSATGYSGTEYLDNTGTVGLFFGLDNANNNTRLNSVANKPIAIFTNSSERMRVTSAGDVGIGTASPSAPLHVSRSTGALLEGIRLTNNNEARITIENTAQSTKYIMAVNNTNPALFFISRDGGGGTIVEVNQRSDAGGVASLKVNGSVHATNVVFSSSRKVKERIQPLDSQEILARLARLSISEWSFKEGPQEARHIGPMAEDFNALFGTSRDTTTISVTDASGVALVAIQALLQRIEDLERRNTELTERLLALETQEAD